VRSQVGGQVGMRIPRDLPARIANLSAHLLNLPTGLTAKELLNIYTLVSCRVQHMLPIGPTPLFFNLGGRSGETWLCPVRTVCYIALRAVHVIILH
jgi:hypothetical protein